MCVNIEGTAIDIGLNGKIPCMFYLWNFDVSFNVLLLPHNCQIPLLNAVLNGIRIVDVDFKNIIYFELLKWSKVNRGGLVLFLN